MLGLGPMCTLYAYTCRKGRQQALDPTMHSHTIAVRTLSGDMLHITIGPCTGQSAGSARANRIV